MSVLKYNLGCEIDKYVKNLQEPFTFNPPDHPDHPDRFGTDTSTLGDNTDIIA